MLYVSNERELFIFPEPGSPPAQTIPLHQPENVFSYLLSKDDKGNLIFVSYVLSDETYYGASYLLMYSTTEKLWKWSQPETGRTIGGIFAAKEDTIIVAIYDDEGYNYIQATEFPRTAFEVGTPKNKD